MEALLLLENPEGSLFHQHGRSWKLSYVQLEFWPQTPAAYSFHSKFGFCSRCGRKKASSTEQ